VYSISIPTCCLETIGRPLLTLGTVDLSATRVLQASMGVDLLWARYILGASEIRVAEVGMGELAVEFCIDDDKFLAHCRGCIFEKCV
jgi:hypothetical protein